MTKIPPCLYVTYVIKFYLGIEKQRLMITKRGNLFNVFMLPPHSQNPSYNPAAFIHTLQSESPIAKFSNFH